MNEGSFAAMRRIWSKTSPLSSPITSGGKGPYYGVGLKVYDWMAGELGLGKSRRLSREEVLELAPTLDADGLRGGVLYHDGQFDDARLAISLAQTAAAKGLYF
jgi:glycerol-3-phosphate dehydrogenase